MLNNHGISLHLEMHDADINENLNQHSIFTGKFEFCYCGADYFPNG